MNADEKRTQDGAGGEYEAVNEVTHSAGNEVGNEAARSAGNEVGNEAARESVHYPKQRSCTNTRARKKHDLSRAFVQGS